jgi:hypothetical protein
MPPKKAGGKREVSTHEELARMAAEGVDVSTVVALAGYAGEPPSDGVVRLHPDLVDLSVSIDISADDIVATRDAPSETMPLGAVVVWLSRTAEVTFRRTRTVKATAQQVRGFFGAAPALVPQSDAGDRLNIQVRPSTRAVPPVYQGPEICAPCTSKNCASRCQKACQSKMEY